MVFKMYSKKDNYKNVNKKLVWVKGLKARISTIQKWAQQNNI